MTFTAVRGRELAAVERAVGQRDQLGNESAGEMVADREHHVEAAAAVLVGIDADRLGRSIFLNVAENGSLFLWAVDRNKGVPLWKQHLSDGDHRQRKQNMSTPSPVTDGRNVWVMTGTGILKGFDFTGKELWMRDIQKEYGRFGLNWGYGSSPMLYEDSLYVQVLHGMKTDDPSYVLRISKATGRTIWRVERPTIAQRESPDSYTDARPRSSWQCA